MKKLLVMMLYGVLMMAFITNKELPGTVVSHKELTGYQLIDNTISLHDYNFWVITHASEFDKTFISDQDAVFRPQFDAELVIGAKVETNSNSYKVQFKKVELHKKEMNVYFSVQRDKVKKEISRPVTLITVAKDREVRKVNLYHDNMLVKSVPIVTVY